MSKLIEYDARIAYFKWLIQVRDACDTFRVTVDEHPEWILDDLGDFVEGVSTIVSFAPNVLPLS